MIFLLESSESAITKMSQQQRVVQLSTASLALVFCKEEDSSRITGGGKYNVNSASGQEIFTDFKAQNLRSFWNKRLVKAVAEVYFHGWMENLVLFVHGNANNLEVLREAWMRRALRSPKGFVIKAVGDLSPVQMSPVPQSQFIPLAEVLCCVISDMNSSNITVNQDALISHMTKAHQGMTIPTQDILYNALGSLIKERKIYHTGEGYFIVTPQTYFITNSLVREKSWWTSGSGDNELPSPPPITYLLSNDTLESHPQSPLVTHCKSCSCFAPAQNVTNAATTATIAAMVPPSVPDQHSVSASFSECTGKSLKWPRDHRPQVQHQSTSTAADYQISEVSKTTTATTTATSRKDKDKDGKEKLGRRFGLNLFRRNGGKKEKVKKEYGLFSGQFPPEEWPVRDEEDLNNLPRDLEHAIIRRINPELTVDNLTRHTVLMKKLEERGGERGMETERRGERGVERDRGLHKGDRVDGGDKGVDKGMSTEILNCSKPRHHQSSRARLGAGAGGRRSTSKASRSKRRAHSSREKRRDRLKTKAPVCVDVDPDGDDLVPSCLRPKVPIDELDHREEPGAVEGKSLYKKRIDNPFDGQPPGKDTATTQTVAPTMTHKEQRRREGKEAKEGKEGKTSGGGRREPAGHRSKSWDPHKAKATAADKQYAGKSHTAKDRSCDRLHERVFTTEPLLLPLSDTKPPSELPLDYSSAYPQSSTLRIDDKVRYQREGKNRGRKSMEGGKEKEGKHRTTQQVEYGSTTDHRHPAVTSQTLDSDANLPSTHPYDSVPAHQYDQAMPWPKPAVHRRHSFKHTDTQGDLTHRPDLLSSHQQACSTTPKQHGLVHSSGVSRAHRSPGHGQRASDGLAVESNGFMIESDEFIEDDHRFYQRAEEEDEDACSSLYLSEEGVIDNREVYQTRLSHYRDSQSLFHDPKTIYQDTITHYHNQPHSPYHDPLPHCPNPHSIQGDWNSTFPEEHSSTIHQDPPLSPHSPQRQEEERWLRVSGSTLNHRSHTSPGTHSDPIPRRRAPIPGERRQDASHSLEALEGLEPPEAADSSIFDYCQTSEVDSDAETLHKSADEGDRESSHWGCGVEEEKGGFETLGERGGPQTSSASLGMPSGAGRGEIMGEAGESQSNTGDSGIDSPRTRVSLATNNTGILEGLNRRGFLQNLEKLHSKSSAMRPQSSLLQLTPVMNV
ncbi:storkhead-box protein 1-like isoform 1-T1 [Salvelinus alpinus]|uniref:storkhead-box protein 1-like n=1 Tax=Salvelinus alpinus TaxID=8036 RepID=UPI0039FBD35D